MISLRWLPLILAALLPMLAIGRDDAKKPRTLGTIERLDPALDGLLDKDAKLEVLGEGYAWVEGPVWNKKGGYLLFSDIPNNSIFKYQPGKKISLFLKPSGTNRPRPELMEPGSNGLAYDSDGRLVMMQHGNRQVARLAKDGKSFEPLASRYMGKRLNSPNDGVFKSNGDLYFTDPPYGQMRKGKPWIFPDEELGFRGVYRLKKGSTKLELLTKEMTFPNGIAFSPDEKTLYVAQSDPRKAVVMAFPVKADGTLGKGKVLYDSTKWVGKKKGLPDGLKVDSKGNLWASGPGGIMILTPAGKLLGVIAAGVSTANCAWGDDGSTLYVAADKALCRIKTKAKGPGF